MARIILLHGWRVRDQGRGSVGPLIAPLEALGHEVIAPSYGYVFSPWATSLASRKTAKLLSTKIHFGDVVIGHSNGARVAWELSYYSPLVRKMVWLNPALDADIVPAKSVKKCLVVHSRRDTAVRVAKWLPGSIWGAMGRVGFRQKRDDPWPIDRRIVNFEHSGKHSDYHINPKHWAEIIDEFISD